MNDTTCRREGCDAPRVVARSGRQYQLCADHMREYRHAYAQAHPELRRRRKERPYKHDQPDCFREDCDRPRAVSKSGKAYRLCLQHEQEWRERRRAEVRAAKIDAELERIAVADRQPVKGMCGPCIQWNLVTEQKRECRSCTDGLKVLAENERWRASQEKAGNDAWAWTRQRRGGSRRPGGGRVAGMTNSHLFARPQETALSGD